MGVTVFLALLATTGVLWFCVRPGATARMQGAAHLLTLLPAVLASLVLLQADSARQSNGPPEGTAAWRVTLAGLQFRLSPGQTLRLGGDADTDHVYVRGMPAGLLQLERNATGELIFKRGASGGVAIVRALEAPTNSSSAENDPVWGGFAVPDGARFCRSERGPCANGVGLSWSAEDGQLRDAANQPLCVLPPAFSGSQRAGELRVYTLADYARPACKGDRSFAWGAKQPASEFFYWGGSEAAPQLYMFPAEGVRYAVAQPDGSFAARQATELRLAVGETRDVYFHRYVRTAASDTPGAAARISRIRDIRSFRIRHTAAGRDSLIEVFLHTPEATRVGLGPGATLTISSKVSNPATLADGAALAGFEVIGAPAATELLNLLKLQSGSREFESWAGQASGCFDGATTLTIRGMARLDCAPVGRWFSIGDPQHVQAKVRVAPLQVPSAWIAALWTLALVNLLIRAAVALPLAQRVVLAFLEVMLTLRLLIAFDASLVDARQEGTVAAAWLALLCMPLVFELLARVPVSTLRAGGARLAKLIAAGAGVWLIGAALDLDSVAAWRGALGQDAGSVLIVCVALAIALATLAHLAGPIVRMVREQLDRLPPWAPLLPLIALTLLHVSLALLGVREQIGGLRLSTLLVPLLVLAWGHWYVMVAQPANTSAKITAALALAFAPLSGFILARDNGAYVYFLALAVCLLPLAWRYLKEHWLACTVAGVLLSALLLAAFGLLDAAFSGLIVVAGVVAVAAGGALFVLHRGGRLAVDPRVLWAVPAALTLTGIVTLHVSSLVLGSSNAVTAAAAPKVQDLDRIVDIQGNSIRLLDLIAPRTVEQLGLRQGYEQRAAMSEMFAYGATLAGRGWPSAATPRELRQTHVDDAVAAVHLLAPFGRIGALGLTAFLVVFAVSVARLLTGRVDIAAQQARLAATLIVVVSLYMLFANIGVVPFTGRNFYFLSVASNSDLLEGGLLLALVAVALLSQPQPQEVRP